MLYHNIKGATPYCHATVAVLNCWEKMRSWGCHMVHHALYQNLNYSYAGVIESLSGTPFCVKFISFEDILAEGGVPQDIDILLNIGDMDTAHGGGAYWGNPAITTAIRRFISGGGGFIGVGEHSACQQQGHTFQLAQALGVEMERGFTLGYDKYNWEVQPHFITQDSPKETDFGLPRHNIYALPHACVLAAKGRASSWPPANTARGVVSISAACLTLLKTTGCCTARCCGARTKKTSFTSGLAKTHWLKYTLTRKTKNIVL